MFKQEDKNISYTVDGVYEWIVAAVTHGQPVTCEKYNIDVSIPETKQEQFITTDIYVNNISQTHIIIWVK